MKNVILSLLVLMVLSPLGQAAGFDLPENEKVIAVSLVGQQKAYPLNLFRELPVLNDRIGRMEIVLFYDGQTDFASAYFRLVGGEPVEFSGRARGLEADDLTTATRWNMSTGMAVGGNLVGMKLIPIPVQMVVFSEWHQRHPRTMVYAP